MPRALAIFVGVLCVLLIGPARARGEDEERETKLKAGLVLNFIRYTEWPAESFASEGSPIVIAVVGNGAIVRQLESTVAGQKVHERSIEVRRVAYAAPAEDSPAHGGLIDQVKGAHVLFICGSEQKRLDGILVELGNADILTVSDMEDFAARNGMLGLTIKRDRVAFDANRKRIGQTRLKVSSQLLRLARIVDARGASK